MFENGNEFLSALLCLSACVDVELLDSQGEVYVFSLLSMYSYCGLCILIVRPRILIVVYVYLLLSTYS